MPQKNLSKVKWFCIGQSGHTIDGREIKPIWLTQAAQNYNLNKYGARINVEHFHAWWPNSEMTGYGDVLALKTEEQEDKSIKLYGLLDPTDKLLELNGKREKVYTSMELVTNFAQTQEAYLTGLAITDTPASLGTTMLKFSADPALANIYISESYESIDMTVQKDPAPTPSQTNAEALTTENASNLFTGLLHKFFGNKETPQAEPKTPATEPQQDYSAKVEALETALLASADFAEKQGQAFADLKKEFEAFKAKIEAEPFSGHRDNHAGNPTDQVTTRY